jgi:hypothetical protein
MMLPPIVRVAVVYPDGTGIDVVTMLEVDVGTPKPTALLNAVAGDTTAFPLFDRSKFEIRPNIEEIFFAKYAFGPRTGFTMTAS